MFPIPLIERKFSLGMFEGFKEGVFNLGLLWAVRYREKENWYKLFSREIGSNYG